MTAYDLMCKRTDVQDEIYSLMNYLDNTTGTVLLTNNEVSVIISQLQETIVLIDTQLRKTVIK